MTKIVKIVWIPVLVFCLIGALLWAVLGNNPYLSFTRVKVPFQSHIDAKGNIVLDTIYIPHLQEHSFFSFLAFVQSGVRIASNSFLSEKPLPGNEQAIIQAIHEERFDPSKIYVISGGHFSDMYLRNLGIFYNALLDGCLPSSQQDWENRERVALQTTAFDLALLSQVKDTPTTFMPIWAHTFVPVNIYTKPSDSLYGILYTLDAMKTDRFVALYQQGTACHQLQTQEATQKLLQKYRPTLNRLVTQYQQEVLDPKTGLVKKSITLSSARDGVKRESSFYDNVIAWKTLQLAKELGDIDASQIDFVSWKANITKNFWDEKTGIFLDDLSSYSTSHHSFSADIFIVVQTGFLDMQNPSDKEKLSRMIAYVQANKLDQPLPLMYSKEDRPDRTYSFVNIASPSYMGRSLWSHWGMEYLKALLLVSPGNLPTVQHFLDVYKQKIQEYGGYPELYDTNGNILHSMLYKSVLHTGWVINYEEVKAAAAQQ